MNKFDVKQKIDNLIYKAYNLFSQASFISNTGVRKLISENIQFKDYHKGGRCFILGTGPSLSEMAIEDVDSLKSEVMFGVNSFYKSKLSNVLRPKYYALVDDLYWKDWSGTFAEVSNVFSSDPPVFITDPRAKQIMDQIANAKSPIYIFSKKYPVDKMSCEITGNIYAPINVVGVCILVAMYMGFKEIYLLGCDYNAFCTAGRGHCYDDEEDLKDFSYSLAFFLKYYWITTEFHYLIAKLAKEKGIRILNLTPSSLLDAYPRGLITDVL